MKRKSLLTLTVLFATAAFTALSLSACANSEETATLPKGWEITDTDGNVDYLTATDENNAFEYDGDYTQRAYATDGTSDSIVAFRGKLLPISGRNTTRRGS